MEPKARRDLIAALSLSLLVLLVYYRTASFGFVNMDDPFYVAANPLIEKGLSLHGIEMAFTQSYRSYWIPATWISYMIDVSLWGMSPRGFHVTNVLLHLFNTVLVFAVFRYASGSFWRSLVAAGLFGLHPMRVESVAWVTERKDVLAGFFYLLAILSYTRYAKSGREGGFWLSVIFAALACMSKPVAVSLPLALLLLDYWPLRRTPEGGYNKNSHDYIKLVTEKFPFFALSAIFSAITLYTQLYSKSAAAKMAEEEFRGSVPGILAAAKSYWVYLGRTFWPVNLPFGVREIPGETGYLLHAVLAAALLAAVYLGWLFRRKYPDAAFGWFWYLWVLLPNSGIVTVGLQDVADRFTYLPHIGLMAGVSWGGARLFEKMKMDKKVFIGIGGAVILVLAVLAWNQTSRWESSEKLAAHVEAESRPQAVIQPHPAPGGEPQGGAAGGFAEKMRIEAGVPPDYYGMVLEKLKTADRAQSLAMITEMEKRHPDSAFPWILKAKLARDEGRQDEAARLVVEVTTKWPNDPQVAPALSQAGLDLLWAYVTYGRDAYQKKDLATAERIFNKVLALDPGNVSAGYNLAMIAAERGDAKKAIILLEEVIKKEPKNKGYYLNLAILKAESGDLDGAEKTLGDLLKAQPENTAAKNMLESVRARKK